MEKFDAKGQVIFVEPSWVTGETCLFFIKNSMEYAMASSKLAKIRKEFLLRLEKEGFIITFDRNYDKDTICLTMDGESFGPSITENEYIKCFNECIAKSGGDKFNYPKTLNVEQYFENSFFPAVFKNTITNGGVDKFLIENQEQLNIIKRKRGKQILLKNICERGHEKFTHKMEQYQPR